MHEARGNVHGTNDRRSFGMWSRGAQETLVGNGPLCARNSICIIRERLPVPSGEREDERVVAVHRTSVKFGAANNG